MLFYIIFLIVFVKMEKEKCGRHSRKTAQKTFLENTHLSIFHEDKSGTFLAAAAAQVQLSLLEGVLKSPEKCHLVWT